MAEAFAAVGFFGLAVAGSAISATYPEQSRMFPWMVCAILGLASLIWFVGALRRPIVNVDKAVNEEASRPLLPVLAGLVLTIAYTVAVILFGYFIPTLIYIPAMAAYLGNRSWVLGIGITLAYAILIYFLFVIVFERPIPLW